MHNNREKKRNAQEKLAITDAKSQGTRNELGCLSPLSKQKYSVYLSDGSHVDYGSFRISDYLLHKDEKRLYFHQRFQNNKGCNNPQSGLYYSAMEACLFQFLHYLLHCAKLILGGSPTKCLH